MIFWEKNTKKLKNYRKFRKKNDCFVLVMDGWLIYQRRSKLIKIVSSCIFTLKTFNKNPWFFSKIFILPVAVDLIFKKKTNMIKILYKKNLSCKTEKSERSSLNFFYSVIYSHINVILPDIFLYVLHIYNIMYN